MEMAPKGRKDIEGSSLTRNSYSDICARARAWLYRLRQGPLHYGRKFERRSTWSPVDRERRSIYEQEWTQRHRHEERGARR